jgi:hypothetical protein
MATRLSLIGWALILLASAWLAVGTVAQILTVGLFGQRPPLAPFDTGLRIVIVAGAVALFYFRRDAFERVTLIAGAAAAGSSALYGFGMRSPGLSAFRLLSHLAAYTLAAIAAGRWLVAMRRRAATTIAAEWSRGIDA